MVGGSPVGESREGEEGWGNGRATLGNGRATLGNRCLLASTASKVEVGGRSSAQGRISSEELGVVW